MTARLPAHPLIFLPDHPLWLRERLLEIEIKKGLILKLFCKAY
jgi:hypothetical protein